LQVGAAELSDRWMDQLSGGEKQRVVLARALAQQPLLLLLDEPTLHLDIASQVGLLDALRRLCAHSRYTVIVVTHEYGVAAVRTKAAKGIQEADLRGDVEVQGGLVEQQKQRLLREGASEDHALLFSAGELVHPAITELGGADLQEGILRYEDVVVGLETEIGRASCRERVCVSGRLGPFETTTV